MNFGKCAFTGHKTQESVSLSVYLAGWSHSQPTARPVDFCLHPNCLHARINGQRGSQVWSHDRPCTVLADIRDVASSDALWGTHAVPCSHWKPSLAVELCMPCYLGNRADTEVSGFHVNGVWQVKGIRICFCLCLLGSLCARLLVLKHAQNT